jgi:preprotein translocase subunit YajC
MTGDDGLGGIVGFLLPLAAMFLLFWALLIRPQQKQQREHREMLAKLERGDAVVTSGGIHGTISGVADDVLTVEIAPGVRVRIDKSAVGRRAAKVEKKDEKKEAKKA